jgi:hypothetical protein
MDKKSPYYRIYLLTVWQEHSCSPPERITWRFRLEDPRSGQQRVFADAATLMNALREIAIATNAAQTQQGEQE